MSGSVAATQRSNDAKGTTMARKKAKKSAKKKLGLKAMKKTKGGQRLRQAEAGTSFAGRSCGGGMAGTPKRPVGWKGETMPGT